MLKTVKALRKGDFMADLKIQSSARRCDLSSEQAPGHIDWNQIPYKGMPRPSEAEFAVIIDKLAQNMAEAAYLGEDNRYTQIREQADKSRMQYISAVSPDRKKLYQEALSMVSKRQRSSRRRSEEPKLLIDYVTIHDGVGQYAKDKRYLRNDSGTTVFFCGSDLEPNTFEVMENPSGKTILGCAKGNWNYTRTAQEKVLEKSFVTRLNAAEERYYQQYQRMGLQEKTAETESVQSKSSKFHLYL